MTENDVLKSLVRKAYGSVTREVSIQIPHPVPFGVGHLEKCKNIMLTLRELAVLEKTLE
jgi:hypothetical protein